MNLNYELNSGKNLRVELASLEQSLDLLRYTMHTAAQKNIDFKINEEDTLQDVLVKNQSFIFELISNPAYDELIKNCCAKVTYDKQKLMINGVFNTDLFEDEKARQDYLPILLIVALENIRPFFPNLHMFFQALIALYVKS